MASRSHTHRERPLLRRIMGELRRRLPIDAVAFHIPNEDTTGSIVVRIERVKDGLLPGCPDVEIIFLGGAYFLEIKDPDGELSENQIKAQIKLRRSAARVETVYSLEEAMDVVSNIWGIPLSEASP